MAINISQLSILGIPGRSRVASIVSIISRSYIEGHLYLEQVIKGELLQRGNIEGRLFQQSNIKGELS